MHKKLCAPCAKLLFSIKTYCCFFTVVVAFEALASFPLAYMHKHKHTHALYSVSNILGDPGAVSRVRRKGRQKVFKYGRKSPWVPTLTELFPKIQADAGS